MSNNHLAASDAVAPPRRHPLLTTLGAGLPLLVGLIIFAGFMWLAAREDGISARDVVLVAPSPFKGIDLVYGMLFASLATVLVATWSYLSELEAMKDRARRGRSKIQAARHILRCTLVLNVALFILILLFKGNLKLEDACSLKTLLAQAKLHDLAVGVIFAAFIVADLLTFLGLRETVFASTPGSSEYEQAQSDSNFALQQLWLVDVPVLIGAIVSVLAIYYAAGVNNWDGNLLHLSSQVEGYMQRNRLTKLLTCDGSPLSLPEFQASIARIFTAGIAMGYLAAHVLMSQFVFIALTVFHRLKQESKLGVTAPADAPAL